MDFYFVDGRSGTLSRHMVHPLVRINLQWSQVNEDTCKSTTEAIHNKIPSKSTRGIRLIVQCLQGNPNRLENAINSNLESLVRLNQSRALQLSVVFKQPYQGGCINLPRCWKGTHFQHLIRRSFLVRCTIVIGFNRTVLFKISTVSF